MTKNMSIPGNKSDVTNDTQILDNEFLMRKENDVLLSEMLHRFKNNLSVIASLLSLQGNYVKDDESRNMFSNSAERVKTIAMIYGKSYQTDDLTGIYFNKYLQDLVIYIFDQYDLASKYIRHEIKTDDVILPIKIAIPCGLIVNELITNSLKHAFKDRNEGCIKVNLENLSGNYILSIEDNGIGFPEDFNLETNDSLGIMLVKLLSEQINGEMDINGINGIKFVLKFRQNEE